MLMKILSRRLQLHFFIFSFKMLCELYVQTIILFPCLVSLCPRVETLQETATVAKSTTSAVELVKSSH